MDSLKSEKDKQQYQTETGGIEYDLSACDLEFLKDLFNASPSPGLRAAIRAELQRRKTEPPDFGRRRR